VLGGKSATDLVLELVLVLEEKWVHKLELMWVKVLAGQWVKVLVDELGLELELELVRMMVDGWTKAAWWAGELARAKASQMEFWWAMG